MPLSTLAEFSECSNENLAKYTDNLLALRDANTAFELNLALAVEIDNYVFSNPPPMALSFSHVS